MTREAIYRLGHTSMNTISAWRTRHVLHNDESPGAPPAAIHSTNPIGDIEAVVTVGWGTPSHGTVPVLVITVARVNPDLRYIVRDIP